MPVTPVTPVTPGPPPRRPRLSRLPRPLRAPALPLTGLLRLGGPSEIWFKPALSVVAAVAPPNLLLLALGRLDLAMYTMAGSLCALYAHNRPYAARARVLAWVVLGMLAGLGAALTVASLTRDTVLLVTAGALLAAAQKAAVDASRLGPPGNVIFTFITSAALFAPQALREVPAHLGLAAAAAAWSWAVGMAPALVRPHGPERRAAAQALTATAAYVEAAGEGGAAAHDARAGASAALHHAWLALAAAGPGSRVRGALGAALTRAGVALAAPADADPVRLRASARALRGNAALPAVPYPPHGGGPAGGPRTVRERVAPVLPLAVRTAVGCALAGYAALALGVGRPYWAIVTAAALYQANVTLSWHRGVQRVLGNVLGVLLFAALAPLTRLSGLGLVLCCVALNFGAEALITRNYWLGTVCVTPMSLLIGDFAGYQQPGGLMADRVLDTLVGALVGFAAAVAVTNRRAGDRIEHALAAVHRARAHSAGLLAADGTDPGALHTAHRALAGALVDLRAATDAAAGEWWQRTALPRERVLHAERAAHRTLAVTVREGARA